MENLRLTRRGLLYFNKRYIIKDIDTNNTIIKSKHGSITEISIFPLVSLLSNSSTNSDINFFIRFI
jgi:hypothetical protein